MAAAAGAHVLLETVEERPQRRRQLIRLGIHPAEDFCILHSAFYIQKRGVPSIRQQWIEMHYGQRNRLFHPEAANLTGTA